jgi:hypothetical protein
LLPRGEKVVDPLDARAIVLDEGTTSLAVSVVDRLMMPRDLVDKARDGPRLSIFLPRRGFPWTS